MLIDERQTPFNFINERVGVEIQDDIFLMVGGEGDKRGGEMFLIIFAILLLYFLGEVANNLIFLSDDILIFLISFEPIVRRIGKRIIAFSMFDPLFESLEIELLFFEYSI